MKTILTALFALATLAASAVTDEYALTLSLYIPQVKNNTSSLGYRKYERQTIKGVLAVTYREEGQATIEMCSLENRSFKVGGKRVTYTAYVDAVRWNLVGNNKTGVFKTPSVWIEAELQPSYVAAYAVTDDNSLVLSISGRGSFKKLKGNVTGTLGCGCTAYGHASPTRVMGACGPLDIVDDVAAVYGTWTARRISRHK